METLEKPNEIGPEMKNWEISFRPIEIIGERGISGTPKKGPLKCPEMSEVKQSEMP
jgi:hypothetical protein